MDGKAACTDAIQAGPQGPAQRFWLPPGAPRARLPSGLEDLEASEAEPARGKVGVEWVHVCAREGVRVAHSERSPRLALARSEDWP